MSNDMHWVGTWATTPDPVEHVAIAGRTIRTTARVSIGGSRVHVRLSNAYGAGSFTGLAAARRGSAQARPRGGLAVAMPATERGFVDCKVKAASLAREVAAPLQKPR